ncbi:MAG: molybdopterin oxidoreductase family protein [Anaerolineae bacterium]|nr:molybdopterin oxidoreductase family protein [Anaerolineae bacterium]
MPEKRTHYRTCNLCEAMCGIVITLDGDQITAIRGDKDDPFSQGHICPKATALQDIHADPDRLRHPVRRTATSWQRISWDDAFSEVVRQIQRIQSECGRNAVAVYQGNPNVHNTGAMLYGAPFIRALRTRNRFSATSVDQLPHHLAALTMFGHQLFIPVPDIDRTDYLLMLGANPLVSNGSLMTAAGVDRRLKAIQARGGKIVVIDPRCTETAQKADAHHFIRPGSDVLFLLALLHVIFAEDWVTPARLETVVKGLESVRHIVAPFAPAVVADVTGISAETIHQIAADFVTAPTAVFYGRMGVSTQQFGSLCHWLINVLNIVTGNFDEPGGAMFPLPAIDIVGLQAMMGSFGNFDRYRSRVRELPAFGGELPVAALAEEITTPGGGQIKLLITNAGNPVLSTSNGAQLDSALATLDFMVSIDIYINETTRHADIILPPTTGLETEHYDLVFHNFAVRNSAKFSPALFEPDEDTRHDWQILRELRDRLEGFEPGSKPHSADIFRRFKPRQLLDLGLRFGPYGSRGGRQRGDGLTLFKLRQQPHGVDLGPLQPVLPQRLFTKDRMIDLAPGLFLEDVDRAARLLETQHSADAFDLRLIGRRQLRSNNSWMHNSARLVKGKNRCTLLINPVDARARALQNGDLAVVTSRIGSVTIEVEISADMMPGVVSVPHGWGHGRTGSRLRIANERPGVSVNDLTDETLIDTLSGNAALNGVPVHVTAFRPKASSEVVNA